MLGTPCQYFPARICCALPKSDINVNIVFTLLQSSSRMLVSLRYLSFLEGGEFNYLVVVIIVGRQFKL